MADDDVDTSRAVVKTYVPEYQKEEWEAHAEQLDMSRSEFVRSMVQAGRRGLLDADSMTDAGDEGEETDGTDGPQFTDQVHRIVAEEGPIDWEDLCNELTTGIEEKLEGALDELQSANQVQYSGRDGGYVLTENDGS